MATTTLKRSMDHLRKQGFEIVHKVEHWNHHGGVRQDLFGFIDVLAIGFGFTVGVQATTMGCIDEHLDKIMQSDNLPELKRAGWIIELHGWRKLNNRWNVHVIPITTVAIAHIVPVTEK